MVEQLLQRWVQALGGLEKLRQIQVVYLKTAIEMGGMKGTIEEWYTVQGQYRQDFDLGGVYRTATVFDHGQAWFRDQNGKVRQLVGTELESEIAGIYTSTLSHLLPGRMPGQAEYAGQDETHEILRVLPEGGRPVTFYLDRRTGLPTKEEHPEAERIRTVHLNDWREVDGVQIAFHRHHTTGDPRYDVVMTIEEARFNAPLEEDTFQKPAEATPDFRFTSGQSALSIPLEFASNHIYLQLRVNESEPLWFLLDTGAAASAIDVEQAKALGLELRGKLEGRGAGEGSIDVSFVSGVTCRLPGVEIVDQTIAAAPLAPLTPFEGRAVHGILGYDLISRFVVEIDYAAGLLHLHDPQGYVYTGSGEALAITLDSGVPFVEAQIVPPGHNPIIGKFLVDTGARMALVLGRPFVERHLLEPTEAITAPLGIGIGGETKQYIGRIPALHLGKITIQNVVAGFSQDVKGAGADPDHAGLIGGDILRRFKAIFDYPGQRMILEKNARFAEPYEYDMSGLFLSAKGAGFDHFEVHRVVGGSPAAEAGLQNGDVIVGMDGRPAAEFTLERIRQLFKEEGRRISLDVRRDETRLSVELKLRRLI